MNEAKQKVSPVKTGEKEKNVLFNEPLLPIAHVPIVTCVFVRRLRYAFLHKYNYVYSFVRF
jgi:hypothetical protein